MGNIDPMVGMRKFGLEFVGDIAWGMHLCQFYETKRDLIAVLVPYIVEGLRSNEFCMWVTSPPLEVEEAKKALKKEVPDLDRYVEKGQIEIISYTDWYMLGGLFDADRVLQGWVEKEKEALKKGFEGLRLTGNTFWTERKDWESFIDYEASVNKVIGSHRMIALCTYSLKKCKGTDIVDVMRNHVGTIIRNGEAWNLVEDVARRKKTEEHIRALGAFPAENPNPIIRVSKDGKILYSNSASLPLLAEWNCSLGQLMPKKWCQRVSEAYDSASKKEVEDSVADRSFSFLIVPIKDAGYVNLYGRDITDQKKAETAIHQSEEKYRSIAETANEGIVLADSNRQIIFANQRFADLLGYTREELVGIKTDYLLLEGQSEKAALSRQKLDKGGRSQEEFQLRRKDGTVIWTHISSSGILDPEGRHVGNLSMLTDITENKRAEQALRESEERFRAIAETSPIQISVSRASDGVILFTNPCYDEAFGFASGELTGVHAPDLYLDPADRTRLTEALKTQGFVKDHVVRVKRKDGTPFWVAASVAPIHFGGEEALLGVSIDVTDRKKAEEELRRLNEELEGRVQERTKDVSRERGRLYNVLETIPAYVVLLDKDYHVPFANKVFRERFGESRGRNCYDFLFNRNSPCENCESYKVLKTNKPHHWEWAGPDGRDYDIYDFPFTEADGSTLILEMGIDITDKKHAETELKKHREHLEELITERTRELQQSEERFSKAFSSSPIALSLTRVTDNQFIDVNETFLHVLEYSREDVIGHTSKELGIFPNYSERERVVALMLEQGSVHDQEIDVRTKTGKLLRALCSLDTINIGGQKHILATVIDITERKKAEEALLENEKRLNRSQEIAHLGSWELDLLTNRLSWSDEVYRIFGLKPQQFDATYEAFLDAVYPDDRAAVDAAYAGSLREGKDGYEIEHRIVRKSDGQIRIVHEKCEHFRDGAGRIVWSVGMVHDITERKKMEQELQRASREWERTFDSVPDLIAILDNQHRIVRANLAMAQQLGLTPEKCIGLPCYTAVHGTDLPPEFCPHAKTLQDGQEHIAEVCEDRLGGDFLVSTTPLKDEQGQIMGSVHVARNITERKKTENQLREARDYLDSLLNYANAPIIVWDPKFRITMFNHAFERLSGLNSSEAIGRPLDILFPKEQKGEAMVYIQRTLAGEQMETVEIPIIHKDGSVRTLLWNSANIKDPNSKKVIATIAQGHDITERKSLEAKLEEYARHLERLVDEKTKQLQDSERLATIGQTAGMVGHDIRNPLQSIEGAVYLAKEEIKSLSPQSPEQKELEEILHIIENQTRYIDHIVADLQDFARTPTPQTTETDLAALVNDALATAKIPKTIEVQTAFQENLKLTVDPVFMKRVIINLIDNGVQAMPSGGKLTLTLTSYENKTSISVQDSGVGIPEKDKPKIYTPLFTTKAKGQGFGLAVCKKLIEAQGGNISFTSEVGKGTSFIVTFPNKKTN